MSKKHLEESYDIINTSPAVAILWRNEENWPVEFVSENVERLLGYSAEELVSGKIHLSDVALPDDLASVNQEIIRNSKEPGTTNFAHEPFRIITKDGTVKWIEGKTFIRRDDKGGITHFQGIVLDVTDRIRAEEELQKKTYELEESLRSERDKLQVVFNAIGDGLYILGQDYTIEYMNKSLANSYDDALGKKCYQTFYNSTAPCDFCMLQDAIETRKAQDIDIVIQKKKSYNIVFSPFLDLDDHVKAIVLRKDISEKKTLEAQAINMSQLASIGELAAGIAHEVNNPITGIISCAELWQSRGIKNGEDIEIPTMIINEGLRASKIVKNLLSFAREKEKEDALLEVEEIISNTLGLTKNQIVKDGIALQVEIPQDLPSIRGISKEIQQVFLNVLSNARYSLNKKYSGYHQDKALKIKTEVVEIESKMLVKTIFHDSGTGIPANMLDQICNPFFSTKPEGEGTGLGLSISHDIISKHGGKLWFESVEGEYTSAVVELPVAE